MRLAFFWARSADAFRQAEIIFRLAVLALAGMAMPAALAQEPAGSVTIAVAGPDAVYGFSSGTTDLNLLVPAVTGSGESPAVALPTGGYTIVADDMTGLGIQLSGISCSGGDVRVNEAARMMEIEVRSETEIVCRFTFSEGRERTEELIGQFLNRQGRLLLTNLPDSQDRIDRLNNAVTLMGTPRPFLESLPGVVAGRPIPFAGSLAALDRLAGRQQQSAFDAWLDGTFALLPQNGEDGRFGVLSMGADYRFSRNLLVGTFLQLDTLRQGTVNAAEIGGAGWTAGGYATMRLNQSLYLDVLGGAGMTSNDVDPFGRYADSFDATRWLLSASLMGEWKRDGLTFNPRARISYFEESSPAFTDAPGFPIEGERAGFGQVSLGPGVTYRLTTDEKVEVATGLRLDTGADILATGASRGMKTLSSRLEGSLNVKLPAGAQWGTTLAYGGIGTPTPVFSARGRVQLVLK